jgi:hypothetical protein
MANGTTKDGLITVSATDQDGEYAGQRVGRVWVGNNKAQGCASWKWYGLGDVKKAVSLEKIAPSLTAEEFDEKLVEAL